jgi:hypothetical protein
MAKRDSRPPSKTSPRPSAAHKPRTNGPPEPRSAGPRPARVPTSPTPPLTSRTTTLDDPLTTSLLAEIARRPSTVEMSPAQIAKANATAPAAPEPEDREPDDPA